MKNILVINQYAGCPKYGSQDRHYKIAKELIKRGFVFCIVDSSFSNLRETPEVSEEIIDEVLFKCIRTPKYRKYGFSRFANMV